jgi:hypothetical protein
VSANHTDSGLNDEQLRESLLTAAEEVLRDKLSEEFAKTKAELVGYKYYKRFVSNVIRL